MTNLFKRLKYQIFCYLQILWKKLEPFQDKGLGLLPSALASILFRSLAKRFRVLDVRTTGNQGPVTGSPYDLAVFGTYLSKHHYATGWTQEAVDLFKRKGGGTYIDVGANIGFTVFPFLNLENVNIYAFEPEPQNFAYLKENIDRYPNKKASIELHQLGFADQEGTLEFAVSDWNHGDHRLIPPAQNKSTENKKWMGEQKRNIITVSVTRMDSFFKTHKLKSPIVLKLDTQGAEVLIMKGGEDILSQTSQLISEFCPSFLKQMGSDPYTFVNLILKHFRSGQTIRGNTDRVSSTRLEMDDLSSQLKRHIVEAGSSASYWELFAEKNYLDSNLDASK